ncbi:MAG: IPT/TIG domain-containing protein [Deltaproteobacteria bacterium]|nr:IPT/TIG domain-containing protein [Deltaproteobacteria bacterium]
MRNSKSFLPFLRKLRQRSFHRGLSSRQFFLQLFVFFLITTLGHWQAASAQTTPDLIISSLSAPTAAGAGITITVKDRTKNQGTGSAGPSITKFYLSANNSLGSGDVWLCSRHVPGLGPGAISSSSTSCTIPAGTATGTYYIIAKADADNGLPESNEGNNTKYKAIKIGPDLIISALSAPTSAGAGSSISVSDTSKNQGAGTAAASTTKFYLSTNSSLGSGDIELGNRAVPSLAPGATNLGTTSVTIPAGTATGTYYVIAKTDADNAVSELNEGNNTKSSKAISITAPIKPVINNLSPTSGPVGTSVTISGSNFGSTQGSSTVTFNGTSATPTSWSATSIVVPVPTGATTGPVVVNVGGVASNGVTFTVVSTGNIAGTVSRMSDGSPISNALVEALQSNVVKGSTKTGADGTYSISGLAAGPYDVRASAGGYATRLQKGTTVTGGATTTVNFDLEPATITYIYDKLGRLISVVDSAGDTVSYRYDAVGNLESISRQNSADVSIIEFSPGTGQVGTSVTISGTGFSPTASENTVTFNGAVATVTSATATQIVTSVPSGATTGPIAVTTPAGSATSSSAFTVTGSSGAPTITGFTPSIGTPGAAVTISGTNFETAPGNNKVKFNVAYTGVSSATTAAIATNVPSGTGSGRISVSTPSGKATSSADFFIPPSPYTAADVEVTGRMAIGESRTVTINTANKIGLIVFDGTAGERISLAMTAVAISSSTVAIRKPDGTSLVSTNVGTSGSVLNTQLPANGTYTILVDPASTNTGSMTLALGAPDLMPTVLTAPASAGAGQQISVSWTVENQGTGEARPTWYDNLYFSADAVCCSGDTSLTSATNSTAVASGGSYTHTKTVTLPKVPAGTYYLILKTDNNGSVYEASEANNEKTVAITIQTPDLVPTALTAPASAGAGQQISVSWTVENQGSGEARPTWYDNLYFSADAVCCTGDTFLAQGTNSAAVAAGGSYTQTKSVTLPKVPAGTYYLIVKADSGNVYEASEANNEKTVAITIQTPDLVPTALTAPASAGAGQQISVSWTVNNQGSGEARPTWYDYLYFSADTVCCTGDTSLTNVLNSTVLAAGGSYTQTKTVTIPNVPAGTYYLIVKADTNGNVYEASETNNEKAVAITIQTPDLVPTALTAPASAGAGQQISVSWTVENQGSGEARPTWYDNLYFSADTVCCTGDTFLAQGSNTTAVASAGNYTQTKTVTLPKVPAGTYYLIVKADSGNVYEASETNNEKAVAITIQTPDLVPTALTAPASAGARQQISVSWTVSNQGSGEARPNWYDYLYFSADTACCSGDTSLTSAINSTAVASGGSYTHTKTVTVPNVPTGNYYVIVKADYYDTHVYEASETNNEKAVAITVTSP